ncbi:MAG: type II secretion system F family protein [Ruminococcus sp.]|nr:type II secretion system F family protein [Ruminococcus sp.]
MSKYSYTAKDASGNVRKGVLIAENEKDFNEQMRQKGLFVSQFKEEENSGTTKTTYKFKTKDLAFNCRQMAAMMTSGLTIVKTLEILCKEQTTEAAKNIWRDIYESVQKGESFSSALEMHNGAFPPLLISMVGAGESSGNLDTIMQRLSDQYAKENKLNNKIKGSMTYPIVLLVLCIVIVIGMFTFIMPTFRDMFSSPDAMPALTRAMFSFSDFLKAKWYILVIAIAVIVFAAIYAMKIPSMKFKWDRFIIKGPYFGPLVVKVYTGRFSRTLSSLYSSGLPMVECLQRSADVLNNTYISEKFETVIDEVKQGEPLSAAIQRTEIFDSMFCSIIYVGEESGALDDILEKSSDYYEEEADSAIQSLVSMMEPLMIIIMGIAVGLVVASVLPALYGGMDGITE